MQNLIVNGLLTFVILTAIVLRFIGNRKNSGMSQKQKTMLVRILIASAMLLA